MRTDSSTLLKEGLRVIAAAWKGFQKELGWTNDVVDKVFREHEPTAVIHLGARAGVRPSIERVPLYVDVNILGTTRLLEACLQFGISKLVFASSSSIYGSRPWLIFGEGPTQTPGW